VAEVGNISITGLQLQLSLLRGRGSAGLVEKVGTVEYGDSTINHKAEVLPEAYAEGAQRKRRRRRRQMLNEGSVHTTS
jgi:hypothetical protein